MVQFAPFFRSPARCCISVLALLSTLVLAQQLVFAPGPCTAVGESLPGAATLAAADFTGDGRIDLIIGSATGLVLLAGAGDSQFQVGRQVMSGCWVVSLLTADFDQDGRADLAAFCSASQAVLILKGLENGQFQETGRLSVSSASAHGMAVTDFNQDGWLDLVVDGYNGVALFAGDGSGFVLAGELVNGLPSLAAAPGDFNGDGIVDLVVGGNGTYSVSIFQGAGGGAFRPPLRLTCSTAGYLNDLAVADLNNDGAADIAAAYQNGLVLWLGVGDGTFQPESVVRMQSRPISIAIADINGDGAKDVLLGMYYGGEISVLRGRGDGGFEPPVRVPALGDIYAIEVADLNEDGKADVAAASYSSESALAAMGRGDGTFDLPAYYGFGGSFLRSSDLNGDGKPDLAVINPTRKSASLLWRGTSMAGAVVWGAYPLDAAFADFNGDGRQDLVAATLGALTGGTDPDAEASLLFAAGRGDGTFEAAKKVIAEPYPLKRDVGSPLLAQGDFSGDLRSGLAFQNNSSNTLSILRGKGDGTFEPASHTPSMPLNALVATDFDGDRIEDLAGTASGTGTNPGTVALWFAARGGTIRESKKLECCSSPNFLVRGDFNGDGKQDLAAVCSAEITLLTNLGAGSFQASRGAQFDPQLYRLAAVTVADFDGDGKDDLIAARRLNSAWGSGIVLLGKSDGTFLRGPEIPLPAEPAALLAQKWGDDGKPGLAVLSALDATIRMMELSTGVR